MENLYDKALNAINKLFSDTLVSKDETRRNLEALRNEIDVMISSL